ncbi:TPA: hypothetical protein EYO77_04050 [Candidatus Poribacteria bacterium]|nr:hypothetical protein [Candidatus Poribacteria bacterium]HIM10265.1 hypothetical protein [Candidatus Poribacteria bacterium]
MKAAVLHKVGNPLCIEDVPIPQIGPDDVLVETKACGICRTDLHIYDGLAYIPQLPHILGHEPAGIVVEVGQNVSGFEIGQRVVPHLFFTCGNCYYCRVGSDAQCANLIGLLGVLNDGAFAEYFVAPAENLFVLPKQISFEVGGLSSCAAITAIHAIRRTRLGPNDTAVIVGSGGIGQILVQILRASGVNIVATSRTQGKLETAKKLGADLALQPDHPDTLKQIKEFAGGDGVQCVFDCVGTSTTMKASAEYVMRGGQIVVIGEEPEFPEIDTIQIAQRELEIIGTRNGSRQDIDDVIGMLAAGIINPPIAKTFPLEEVNQALDLMRIGGVNGRIVITVQ